MYKGACLHVFLYMCAWHPWRPLESILFPGTGVSRIINHHVYIWKLNLSPLEALSVPLTAEPFFWPQNPLFLKLNFRCVLVSVCVHIVVHTAYLVIY